VLKESVSKVIPKIKMFGLVLICLMLVCKDKLQINNMFKPKIDNTLVAYTWRQLWSPKMLQICSPDGHLSDSLSPLIEPKYAYLFNLVLK
jgi:hypothetical protein